MNFTYPHAWRYRDYVIDSFNANKPYDQFIREQIAGDLLATPDDRKWQENTIATGFLALGTKGLNEPNPRQFRMDVVDEQIDTVSQAILGITVACARCHDHKSDPIPTTDYYALAGIFRSTNTYYGTNEALQNKRPSDLILLPFADEYAKAHAISAAEYQDLERQLQATRGRLSRFRGPGGQSMANSQQARVRSRAQASLLTQKLQSYFPDGTPKTLAMGAEDSDSPENASVLIGGDVEKPAQEVDRGFLQVLNFAEAADIDAGKSGRLELAGWLTSKENPLTARVMVNRIWQELFGEGLVATPNNWGVSGQAPSHPRLLDNLAVRFMENDWSVKSVIREIVLTRTYQLSSQYNAENFGSDPDNRLRWRTAPRQLDAEALRDAMLLVSGNINGERPIGSVVSQFSGGRAGRQVDPGAIGTSNHRSVYLPLIRGLLPESLALFDYPDFSAPSAKRGESNMPSQSLYLLNSEFIAGQAASMAQRLIERFPDRVQRIKAAFALAYSRPATDEEVQGCSRYFEQFGSSVSLKRSDPKQVEQLATEAFCQTLLSSAEFRILD